jgi:hypothetical protein
VSVLADRRDCTGNLRITKIGSTNVQKVMEVVWTFVYSLAERVRFFLRPPVRGRGVYGSMVESRRVAFNGRFNSTRLGSSHQLLLPLMRDATVYNFKRCLPRMASIYIAFVRSKLTFNRAGSHATCTTYGKGVTGIVKLTSRGPMRRYSSNAG